MREQGMVVNKKLIHSIMRELGIQGLPGPRNTTVVKHLLADLVARNLRFEQGLLVVIDGGKALAAGTASSAPLVEPLTQRSDNGGTVQASA
jgi:hypothetical protein